MRQLTISSFTQARDNQASRHVTDFAELVKEFENPKIIDEPATEKRASELKPLLPAWSPATYHEDARADANVERVSCLVYDLDGEGKLGLDPDSIKPRWAYALHSTTRSGFCKTEGHAKLRLVIPLAHDIDAEKYKRLWRQVAQELGIAEHCDGTRLHPGGIFFAPAIFAEHKDKYLVRSDTSLPWLDPEPSKFEALYESVRNATEKDNAISRAAYLLAKEGEDDAAIVSGLLDALRENERRGSSLPVDDWEAAERTIKRRTEAGKAERASNLELERKFTAKQVETQTQEFKIDKLDGVVKEILRLAKKKEISYEKAAHHLAEHKDKLNIEDAIGEIWKAHKCPITLTELREQIKRGLEAPPPTPLEDWEECLIRDAKGYLKGNRYNVSMVLKHHPDLMGVAYNVRTQTVTHPTEFPWGENVLQKHHGLLAAQWCAKILSSGDGFSPEAALKDLGDVARKRQFDPFTIWVEGLVCETDDTIYVQLCVNCLGAEPTEYHLMVLKRALVMTLKRQFEPGAKADYMPILEGGQGIGKTTFLRQLFPPQLQSDCYGVMGGDITDRGTLRQLGSAVVLEVGELNGMRQKEVTAFKQFLTIQEDKVRPLFTDILESCARRAVLWGTTNEDEYLKDTTGNRRFWPVKITKVDFNWLNQNREKLWKTIHKDYLAGAETYPSREDEERLFAPEQEQRRETDILEDLVIPYLSGNQDLEYMKSKAVPIHEGQFEKGEPRWWATTQLATLLEMRTTETYTNRRIGLALRKHGWVPGTQRVNGKPTKVWRNS